VRNRTSQNEVDASRALLATIKGAPEGKPKGKTVVLKDNIMLAGVPMMNGIDS
jgi:amidase